MRRGLAEDSHLAEVQRMRRGLTEDSPVQIWTHFALKPPRPPRPELRKEAANGGGELPTAEAGPGGTLCTSHALPASPRPLARMPRTKRTRRRN